MQTITELEIYQAGKLTVIGFGGREILDSLNLAECHDEIVELISEHNGETLALDLTGVRLIPTGMLGLLASVQRKGIDIHLYNPSDDIREVLVMTKLDRFFYMHDIDI